MKAVILAGGYGTRISEESQFKPKPMLEIGNMPILWHIMKEYSAYGIKEFIICAGYKQNMIKEWFADYFLHTSDVTFDFSSGNDIVVHRKHIEPWRVTVVDTGLGTQTAGRIKRIQEYVGDETFMLTYGDGVGDVDIGALQKEHEKHGRLGTVSVYNFGQTKGVFELGEGGMIRAFREKSNTDGDLINIGYMVLEPEVFAYIRDDNVCFEQQTMKELVRDQELVAYIHKGFWQCMDTLRDKKKLEALWESGQAPWKIWG